MFTARGLLRRLQERLATFLSAIIFGKADVTERAAARLSAKIVQGGLIKNWRDNI